MHSRTKSTNAGFVQLYQYNDKKCITIIHEVLLHSCIQQGEKMHHVTDC